MKTNLILDTPIFTGTKIEFLDKVLELGKQRISSFVCFCNVHMLVTAQEDELLRSALNKASLIAPDGAPVAFLLRKFRFKEQEKISGPDLMWESLLIAEREGVVVSFYGSKQATLNSLASNIKSSFPKLKIGSIISPPFRALSTAESTSFVSDINNAGTHILFVGLGCPKQEIWMSQMRGSINSIMLGVGAAFDFHSGVVTRAPVWMQKFYLEWLFRLFQEPRRLWKRYFYTNTKFIIRLISRRGLS